MSLEVQNRCEADDSEVEATEVMVVDNMDEFDLSSADLQHNIICSYQHCNKHSKQDGWMVAGNWVYI